MRWSSWSVLSAAFVVGCAGLGHRESTVASSAVHREPGALLLMTAGAVDPWVVPGTFQEVVRGSALWHVDGDVAARSHQVLRTDVQHALTLPVWLGGGLLLCDEDGAAWVLPSGVVRPLVRAPLSQPHVGRDGVWAQLRVGSSGGDWVHIALPSGKVELSAPPIGAPLLSNWTTTRSSTSGPEFVGSDEGIALVDALGAVRTSDGGRSWTPVPGLEAHFREGQGPSRLLRVPQGIVLAGPGDQAAVFAPSRGLSGWTGSTAVTVPPSAQVDVEAQLPWGVPIGDDQILVADGSRLAVVSLHPLRVVKVARNLEHIRQCALHAVAGAKAAVTAPGQTSGAPAARVLAQAACARSEGGAGPQLVIGWVVEGEAGLPELRVERVFPFVAEHNFSSTGGVVVAAPCESAPEQGLALTDAARVCVRSRAGRWAEVAVESEHRRAIVPRADGSVAALYDGPRGSVVKIAAPGGRSVETPLTSVESLGRSETKKRSGSMGLVGFDEVDLDRLVLWWLRPTGLTSITMDGIGPQARITKSAPLPVEAGGAVGVFGQHAMSVRRLPTTSLGDDDVGTSEISVTSDAGRTWSRGEWPAGALVGRSTEPHFPCGPLGCRIQRWVRVGWQPAVSLADRVLDLRGAPVLPEPPAPPRTIRDIEAICEPLGPPRPVSAAAVPVQDPNPRNAALLGLGEIVAPPGQVVVITPFLTGATRGGLISTGPANGPWGDAARTVVRFASDLDSLDAAWETAPSPSPFVDHRAALRAWGGSHAVALGPGRVLIAVCEDQHCTGLYRASSGATLAPVQLDLREEAFRIVNARELDSVLAITGKVWPANVEVRAARATSRSSAALAAAQAWVPFVSVGLRDRPLTTTLLQRASETTTLAVTVDPERGRFGLAEWLPVPTWTGGTSYVIKLDADGRPSGGFEALPGGPSDLSHPSTGCREGERSWDRGEQNLRLRVRLAVNGEPPIIISTDSHGGLRMRLGERGVCLERLTVLDDRRALQLDGSTGRATLGTLGPGRTATQRELKCELHW